MSYRNIPTTFPSVQSDPVHNRHNHEQSIPTNVKSFPNMSATSTVNRIPGVVYSNSGTALSSSVPPHLAQYGPNYEHQIPTNTRYIPEHRGLSRSGLSFDGSPTGIPINLFLFQLETLAASMSLTAEQILTEVSFILKGVASHWYWTFRQQNPTANWYEVRHNMVERFKNRRPDSDIESKIESRKQLPNESFLEFYQQIWSLTVQLSTPIADHQLIKILMKNMRPGLRYQLTDRHFENIGDLISSCTSWENTWSDLKIDPDLFLANKRAIYHENARFVPQRRTINSMDQPLNSEVVTNTEVNPTPYVAHYLPTQVAAIHRPNVVPNRFQHPEGPSLTTNSNPLNTKHTYAICFNCDDIGHFFTECPVPPTRWFCYKCGMKDTVTPKCPNCSGNVARGQWRSGNQGPPRYVQPNSSQNPTMSHPK